MIVAVISKKGGVGKTTTSVSLGAALALEGHRVLVIDLDPNAGASLSLGLDKSQLAPGAADVLLRGLPAWRAVRRTEIEGLSVLPASVDLRHAEHELSPVSHRERVLAERLEAQLGGYDHVFLDCPSALGILTQNALVASDAFLVPATPHFLAHEGLEHLVATAERLVWNGGGRRIRFLGIVLTAVDYRVRTTRGILSRIRRRFGSQVFAVEIRTNFSLAEAPAYGKTVFGYRPNSTGARSYKLLAEEFLMQAAKKAAQPPAAEALAC
jgi:chromosome partitioning protein